MLRQCYWKITYCTCTQKGSILLCCRIYAKYRARDAWHLKTWPIAVLTASYEKPQKNPIWYLWLFGKNGNVDLNNANQRSQASMATVSNPFRNQTTLTRKIHPDNQPLDIFITDITDIQYHKNSMNFIKKKKFNMCIRLQANVKWPISRYHSKTPRACSNDLTEIISITRLKQIYSNSTRYSTD